MHHPTAHADNSDDDNGNDDIMGNRAEEHLQSLCCPIVELRQYTLHPGQRDALIELFEREFIESQEAVGITVIGQFRDLNDPNRFVWLRGFANMATRKASLQAFYGGSVWQAHRDAANATMVDSDNVLLLRPAHSKSGFSVHSKNRPPRGAKAIPPGLIVATILSFGELCDATFPDYFEQTLAPILIKSGASVLSSFVTEQSANNFLALPVREGEQVFVWFSRFREQAAHKEYAESLSRSKTWRDAWDTVEHQLEAAPEVLVLEPTARSLAHG